VVEEFDLATEPLIGLVAIVRGADTGRMDDAPQAVGLLAASLGLSRMYSDDLAQLESGMALYDASYGACQHAVQDFIEVDMYTAAASLVRRDQIENIIIPAGDPGEQLVANLILALMVCQLHTLPNAIAYIARAHELAVRLESQTLTYTPEHPSKFARIEFEQQGETETLLFSFINDVLVMPRVGPGDLAKFASTTGPAINLANLDVAQFMLRLQTRRLVIALETLKKTESAEEFTDVTRRILTKCLYQEIQSARPLGRADDCCSLASDLIGKRNFQMAALALKKADSELELYMRTTPPTEHSLTAQEMKEQIAAIVKKLQSGAA
jgi:Chromate resistance exported protein